eukprot:CAMPEP_0175879136 /NCGR_PEP_ID=MMETSP0107_2-20121207/41593_1 /TAXON_ID=195067 ORGANISM="Goniomonas pacifica, Strain CCMP1869" /NCGR_SAMPLE_ID=MMETSP0107_2 /ASSEMBLY_ACC=CAM_ASM_000203 /LENGTH=54 /DNA_ID=CAMNT_0017198733 /DNA_START=59 /DNA_END=220 /DNA_ORIENTATION=-
MKMGFSRSCSPETQGTDNHSNNANIRCQQHVTVSLRRLWDAAENVPRRRDHRML